MLGVTDFYQLTTQCDGPVDKYVSTTNRTEFIAVAPVAQLAARRIHSPKVEGSTPSGGIFWLESNPSGTYTISLVGIEPFWNIHSQRGISSIGRVRRSQRRGTGIETPILHLSFWILLSLTNVLP